MQDTEDKTITIVNRAKVQTTLADYELAQEDYRRKLLKAEAEHRLNLDDPATVVELQQLLARSDLDQEDREMLERRLMHELKFEFKAGGSVPDISLSS
jgi:hypothetical protein